MRHRVFSVKWPPVLWLRSAAANFLCRAAPSNRKPHVQTVRNALFLPLPCSPSPPHLLTLISLALSPALLQQQHLSLSHSSLLPCSLPQASSFILSYGCHHTVGMTRLSCTERGCYHFLPLCRPAAWLLAECSGTGACRAGQAVQTPRCRGVAAWNFLSGCYTPLVPGMLRLRGCRTHWTHMDDGAVRGMRCNQENDWDGALVYCQDGQLTGSGKLRWGRRF
jgi:hypothetical protein